MAGTDDSKPSTTATLVALGQDRGGAPAVSEDAVPGMVLGQHRLLRRIGAGGMGTVYEAQHVVIGAKAAVKVLHAQRHGSQQVARLRQEAEAASRIGHPNIVTVSDFGTTPAGHAYLVMELLRGRSLQEYLKAQGSVAQVLAWLHQCLAGLEVAHACGIVHRDLKPANIFLHTLTSGETVAKILDFGIAKMAPMGRTEVATLAGTLLGTPHYIAPEHVMGGTVDGRADLYSLGVILYEVLTGQVPFSATTALGVLTKHLEVAPLDPRQAAPQRQIPGGIAQLTMALLAKDPNARPGDARKVREALTALKHTEAEAWQSIATGTQANATSEEGRTASIPGRTTSWDPDRATHTTGSLAPGQGTVRNRGVARGARTMALRRALLGAATGFAVVAMVAVLLRGRWGRGGQPDARDPVLAAPLDQEAQQQARAAAEVGDGRAAGREGPVPSLEIVVPPDAPAGPSTPSGLEEPTSETAQANPPTASSRRPSGASRRRRGTRGAPAPTDPASTDPAHAGATDDKTAVLPSPPLPPPLKD